ncbi:MAG: hypothetical protein HXY40_03030 [Chloroflexi bacterium]|nr:hypothetical protein [Chloroflexota bacterium]
MIAVLTDLPVSGAIHVTPYGDSAPIAQERMGEHNVLWCAPALTDPRATIHALHMLGAHYLWLCETAGALSPLLETGDWLVADDFIDGTRGQHYTFFSDKAGGFVQQVPPFDAASREALLRGAETICARPFRRGVYVCVSSTRLETPAEAAFWARAGAQVVGRYLSPYLPLAREREMRVAALLYIGRGGGQAAAAPLPPATLRTLLAAALGALDRDSL